MNSDYYDAEKILNIAREAYSKKRYAYSAYLAYVALCEYERVGNEEGIEASIVEMQFAINGIQNYLNNRLNKKPEFAKALEVVKKILMFNNSPNLSKILNDVAGRDSPVLEEVVAVAKISEETGEVVRKKAEFSVN